MLVPLIEHAHRHPAAYAAVGPWWPPPEVSDTGHAAGELDELDAEGKAANDTVSRLADGRLFSSYDTPEHGRIWVITEDLRAEAGGPTTTVLFPNDY